MANSAEARHSTEMKIGLAGTGIWAIGWMTGFGLLSTIGGYAAVGGFGARGAEAAWSSYQNRNKPK